MEKIRLTLGHEDFEETITTLIELGIKAVSLTTKEQRMVKMFGGERRDIGERCKTCGNQRTSYSKEASVEIGVSKK